MKSVTLIRHVKSDWSNFVEDFDRPVREDRKDDAKIIAKEIAKKGASPQCVICSTALRTMQTAKLLCTEWGFPVQNIITDKSLYECTASDILDVIRAVDDKYSNIAVVCHNPAITVFTNQYSTASVDNMPTTGAVNISFETDDWQSILLKGKANWILRPKELKAASGKSK